MEQGAISDLGVEQIGEPKEWKEGQESQVSPEGLVGIEGAEVDLCSMPRRGEASIDSAFGPGDHGEESDEHAAVMQLIKKGDEEQTLDSIASGQGRQSPTFLQLHHELGQEISRLPLLLGRLWDEDNGELEVEILGGRCPMTQAMEQAGVTRNPSAQPACFEEAMVGFGAQIGGTIGEQGTLIQSSPPSASRGHDDDNPLIQLPVQVNTNALILLPAPCSAAAMVSTSVLGSPVSQEDPLENRFSPMSVSRNQITKSWVEVVRAVVEEMDRRAAGSESVPNWVLDHIEDFAKFFGLSYKGRETEVVDLFCSLEPQGGSPRANSSLGSQDLKLGNEEITRLRNTDLKNLLRNKKLYLVLDLDHTLLNSTRLVDISSEEEYLKSQTDSLQDVSNGSLFRLDSMHMLTKLRPFIHTFLKEASSMFEMYIYTMAERSYALEIAKLLDPGRVYFNSKVISQADCTQRHQKGLDVVLGQESAVVILDDTEIVSMAAKVPGAPYPISAALLPRVDGQEGVMGCRQILMRPMSYDLCNHTYLCGMRTTGLRAEGLPAQRMNEFPPQYDYHKELQASSTVASGVSKSGIWKACDPPTMYWRGVWQKHKGNLILMERYHFFSSSCRQFGFNCKSLSESKSDENESDGALATVLKVLKQIHKMFFDPVNRDVRQVLKTVRQEVLKDCKLVFSRVFPTKFHAENHQLWKMAEQLGATCSTELDTFVTHVVSTDTGTEKARWAVQHKKFLVHPQWIEASNYMWQRQPEDKFTINHIKKQ
ncbi:hypothetical protein HHK36_025896 [Tetracentron sinense]|uniref:RNA polymerase II C-terminal domain phosphatase-like n=1 Tax=Tetracentron sinense TaxID=13715 RepID=A0A835D3J4_TETSI|nr:hypothetical protein HHK36_025896 [Tetracentron sinense]